MKRWTSVLLGFLLSAVMWATALAAEPRLQVLESALVSISLPDETTNEARVSEWTRLKVALAADETTTVVFAPNEVFLEMPDSSRTTEWGFDETAFFHEAVANLKAGDRINSVNWTQAGGNMFTLTYFCLVEGSTATLEIPLAAGVKQEATLYFRPSIADKTARLKLGTLSAAIVNAPKPAR